MCKRGERARETKPVPQLEAFQKARLVERERERVGTGETETKWLGEKVREYERQEEQGKEKRLTNKSSKTCCLVQH